MSKLTMIVSYRPRAVDSVTLSGNRCRGGNRRAKENPSSAGVRPGFEDRLVFPLAQLCDADAENTPAEDLDPAYGRGNFQNTNKVPFGIAE